jgi:hypothetical protein
MLWFFAKAAEKELNKIPGATGVKIFSSELENLKLTLRLIDR